MNIAMIVHNRPRLTKQCIESLYATTKGFSLSVVDDASDKETQNTLEEMRKQYGFKLRTSYCNVGVGATRNESIEFALENKDGDLIYVTDNDCFFLPLWKSILYLEFINAERKYNFALLGAYNHPYNKPIGWEKNGKGDVYESQFIGREIWSCYAVGSMSWLMGWETWDKYGPLTVTEPGKIGSSEDHEFCQKIRADGKKVGCVNPPLILNCGRTNSLGQLSPGDDLLMQQKFPDGVIVE